MYLIGFPPINTCVLDVADLAEINRYCFAIPKEGNGASDPAVLIIGTNVLLFLRYISSPILFSFYIFYNHLDPDPDRDLDHDPDLDHDRDPDPDRDRDHDPDPDLDHNLDPDRILRAITIILPPRTPQSWLSGCKSS